MYQTKSNSTKYNEKRSILENSRMFCVIIIHIIHSFYIALFSDLEQTHCAHVACDSELVTVSFYSAYIGPKPNATAPPQ